MSIFYHGGKAVCRGQALLDGFSSTYLSGQILFTSVAK